MGLCDNFWKWTLEIKNLGFFVPKNCTWIVHPKLCRERQWGAESKLWVALGLKIRLFGVFEPVLSDSCQKNYKQKAGIQLWSGDRTQEMRKPFYCFTVAFVKSLRKPLSHTNRASKGPNLFVSLFFLFCLINKSTFLHRRTPSWMSKGYIQVPRTYRCGADSFNHNQLRLYNPPSS